jgi:hypothetical protein
MPEVTQAVINSALSTVIKGVSNQVMRGVVLAQILDNEPADGKNISWAARFGDVVPSTGPIADGANVSTFNNDEYVPASLEFTTYHEAFKLTGRAMAAAAVAGGPAALANLFAKSMSDAAERLARRLGQDLYVGTGASNQIMGLCAASAPAIGDTGVYANIDRAVRTQWQSTVIAAGGATLSVGMLREMRRRIYEKCGEKVDLIVGAPFQQEKYAETFGPNRRYLDTVRRSDGAVIKLDGGYNVLELDGIPFIEDAQVPAGEVVFLNTRRVRFRTLPNDASRINGGIGTMAIGGTPEEQMGEGKTKLVVRVQPLAIQGDSYPFVLYIYPQVQVEAPNTCGRIAGLATS